MNSEIYNTKRRVGRTAKVLTALLPMIATGLAVVASPSASAATTITLGTSNNFAVLAGGGISNTGNTAVQGDIGAYPTVSFTDAGALVLSGAYHFGDATAIAAKAALATAYSAAATSTPSSALAGDLGGKTLLPGVYSNSAGIGVTGTLTLDAQGNPNSVFIIQTPAGLNTAAASQVNIVNGGQACNVFWQVGTTTNLGANSDFKGNLLTNSNFVGGVNAKVAGRVFSLTGSVALNSNTIVKPNCVAPEMLFVTPESKTVAFGSSSVSFSAKYQTMVNNVATTVGNPTAGNVGWVVPVCAATPAYTATSPVGSAVITCTGGNGGSLYVLDRSRTASLTITKAETKINVVSSPKEKMTAGTAITFSGTVSPKNGVGVCTGPVTFSLDKSPLTGVAGVYAITSPVVTTNWMNGSYRLIASYPGDINCLASTNNSTEIKIGTAEAPKSQNVVNAAGSYLSPFGKASFNLQIKSTIATATTPVVVTGKVKWMVDKQWKFEGTLNSYSVVNGVGTATGTGTLSNRNRSDRKGKWTPATTGASAVTIKFTVRSKGDDDDNQRLASFAIGFTGTAIAGIPALPVLGPLVVLGKSSH